MLLRVFPSLLLFLYFTESSYSHNHNPVILQFISAFPNAQGTSGLGMAIWMTALPWLKEDIKPPILRIRPLLWSSCLLVPHRNTSYIYAVPCQLLSALWPHTLLLMTVQPTELFVDHGDDHCSQQWNSFFSPGSTQQSCVKTLLQCQNLVYWEDTLSHEGHCSLVDAGRGSQREICVLYSTSAL